MTTYREAGVDQQAADALVPIFAKLAARTARPEVLDEVGGFAGLFSLERIAERGYRRPALVCSTDGVGTKVELLRAAGMHHTAGWDAVAMNVDDVVCCGAEPIFFVDYVSVDRLDPRVMEEIVGGVADGCAEAGCALVGGETSQHPGLLPEGGYDVVGTCVGLVDLDRLWGPGRVRAGDAIVGLASSGLHANGFALVRMLAEREGIEVPPELLAPTAIYARAILEAASRVEVGAVAHVTGGGIAGNLARVLPEGLGADVDTAAWHRPEVFGWLSDRGVDEQTLRDTFNLGLGMLVVTRDPEGLIDAFRGSGEEAFEVGRITDAPGVGLRG